MSGKLDHLLEALRGEPVANLPALEGQVWDRIDAIRERRDATSALVPLRVASVVAALGLGLVGGSLAAGAATRAPAEIAAFSLDARLAPSTLLDGR
jgi:hypothetical protein